MSNANTLHLTADETKHLFAKLPDALKSKWKKSLQEEVIDAYETPEELVTRFENSRFEFPGSAEYVRKMKTGVGVEPIDFRKLSEESLAEYFAVIGATGASALIQLALQEKDVTDEDMQAIAGMTRLRHVLLQDNAAKKR